MRNQTCLQWLSVNASTFLIHLSFPRYPQLQPTISKFWAQKWDRVAEKVCVRILELSRFWPDESKKFNWSMFSSLLKNPKSDLCEVTKIKFSSTRILTLHRTWILKLSSLDTNGVKHVARFHQMWINLSEPHKSQVLISKTHATQMFNSTWISFWTWILKSFETENYWTNSLKR